MYRRLTNELVLFCVIAHLIHPKEDVLYCPNARLPELDENGAIKQCLPGQGEACGSGYTCFFSGTNYQCCPAEEEDKEESNLDPVFVECPPPRMTVLTDAGLPLTCIPGLRDCPQINMQCINVGRQSICCERSSIVEKSSDGDVLPLNELNASDDPVEPIETSNEFFGAPSLECPEPAFTVLDGNGDPIRCDEEDCAHQTDRFCYKTLGASICCEDEERAVDDDELIKKFLQENKRERNDRTGWSPLKYSPLASSSQQQQSKLFENSHRQRSVPPNLRISVSKAPILDGSTSEGEQQKSGLSVPAADELAGLKLTEEEGRRIAVNKKEIEALLTAAGVKTVAREHLNNALPPPTLPTTSITSTIPSTTAATTATSFTAVATSRTTVTSKKNEQQSSSSSLGEFVEFPSETIRYKPHSAGGYAVSRTFSTKIRRAPDDARALARQYLLEQIRRGWPYSEEFYRTYVPFNTQSQVPGAEVTFHE